MHRLASHKGEEVNKACSCFTFLTVVVTEHHGGGRGLQQGPETQQGRPLISPHSIYFCISYRVQ